MSEGAAAGSPWWEAMAPATTHIVCGRERHEVVWQDGTLSLPAHGDVAAEQALGALGGTVPECLVLRDAWRAHAADPAVITLGRRPGEAGLGFAADEVALVALARSSVAPGRREELIRLFALPAAFIDRLVLEAMAAAAAQWPDEAFRDRHGLRVGAALAARATPALQRLGAGLAAPEEAVVVHCLPAAPGATAAISARRSDEGLEVSAALPLEWLSRVWGPGLSEPAGRFVVDRGRRRLDGSYDVEVAEWAVAGTGRWEVVRRAASLARDRDGAWRVAG